MIFHIGANKDAVERLCHAERSSSSRDLRLHVIAGLGSLGSECSLPLIDYRRMSLWLSLEACHCLWGHLDVPLAGRLVIAMLVNDTAVSIAHKMALK